jgi:hypothetical protein
MWAIDCSRLDKSRPSSLLPRWLQPLSTMLAVVAVDY